MQKDKLKLQSSDFQKVTILFIKEARGSVSQEFLSHQLEANFNIVNRWETGRRGFYWSDFLSLASVKNWNVSEALNKVTHFEFSSQPGSHEVIDRILLPSVKDVLKNDLSVQKLNRLAAGKSKLLFADFLLILERVYGRSEFFINQLLELSEESPLKSFFSYTARYRDLIVRDPFHYLLQMALLMKAYRDLPAHSNAFLAKILGTSESDVLKGLNNLEEIGAIEKRGESYITSYEPTDTGSKSRTASKKIVSHFRKKITEVSEKTFESNPPLMSSYLAYPTHPDLEAKIFELCRKFYIDLRNTIAENENKEFENLRYIGIDLFYPFGSVLSEEP